MAKKIISMEIGSFFTKICEMEYTAKNPKIYHSFMIETPTGVLDDGMVRASDIFINRIKESLHERKITTKQVVFTISSTKIATREVLIPFVKENRISSLVQANASIYFPVNVTKYKFAHNILGVVEEEKGPKQYKIMVLAAPDTLLESYHFLAGALGKEVVTIDFIGNSIYQAVRTECIEGIHMVIKVDEFSTLLTVIDNSTIALSRTIPYGINEGMEALVKSENWGENLTFSQAVEIAKNENVISESTISEITYSFSTLGNAILRVIDYYNSNNSGKNIGSYIFTGIGSDILGLQELLSTAMNIEIRKLSKLEGMNLEKAFPDLNFGEYIGCIGAAIAPLHFYSHVTAETSSKKAGLHYDPMSLAVGTLIFCVAVSVALALIALIPYQNAKSQNEELKTRQTELLPVKEIYQNFLNASAIYEKTTNWDNQTRTDLDQIVDFIEELEEKMPSTFAVDSMMGDQMGISMEVKVASKEEAARVISQLRTFASASTVTTSSITEVVSDAGEVQVVFSVQIGFEVVAEQAPVAEQPATPPTGNDAENTEDLQNTEELQNTEDAQNAEAPKTTEGGSL